jgi:glutathione S-transferase
MLQAKGPRLTARFHKLNKDLANSTFFEGNQLTLVDLFYYVLLHDIVVQTFDIYQF